MKPEPTELPRLERDADQLGPLRAGAPLESSALLQDTELAGRSVLRPTAAFLSVCCLLALVVRDSLGPFRLVPGLTMASAVVIFALCALGVGRWFGGRLAAPTVIATYLMVVFVAGFFGGGSVAPTIPFLAIAPLLAAFLISARAGAITAAAVIAVQLIFLNFEEALPVPLVVADGWSYFVMLALAVLVTALVAQRHEQENLRLRSLLTEQARCDWLTSLANRRGFEEVLAREIARTERRGGVLSLLIADIDLFKQYNDTYGHQEGDRCLVAVADAMRTLFRREVDSVARLGGEEFVVLLPDTGRASAEHLATELRQAVEDLRIPHEHSPYGVLTVSVGSATATRDAVHTLLKQADDALYRAKDQGRNEVCAVGTEAA